jgi:hypothetical protein
MRKEKYIPSTRLFARNDVFAAAVTAQRINGEYVKATTTYKPYPTGRSSRYAYATGRFSQWKRPNSQPVVSKEANEPVKTSNREIMKQLLNNGNIGISKEDYEKGEIIRLYYAGQFDKVLDETASDFLQQAISAATTAEIVESSMLLSVIASLPSSYERNIIADATTERRIAISVESMPLKNPIGSHVKFPITIETVKFSNKFMVNIFNATTTINGQLYALFFMNKDAGFEVGRTYMISAKVKRVDGNTTQLHYVKLKG